MYLKPTKIDLAENHKYLVFIHKADAQELGIEENDMLFIKGHGFSFPAAVEITESLVKPHEIGIDKDLTEHFKIDFRRLVEISLLQRPKAVDFIAKKLKGADLSEKEIFEIMKSISKYELTDSEMAFFMATFFNPGFNESELKAATEAMAKTGSLLNFKNIRKNKKVVDKHSIGGTASKGITPILVSIIASLDIVIPNTSSRAITSPAGTSDVLDILMPVDLNEKVLYKVVKKSAGCMVWGGGLNLAPADDILIRIEKPLRVQSFEKILMSIIAKKVAMGITDLLIDIPYGPASKVKDLDQANVVEQSFLRLTHSLGINCVVTKRHIKGPDGKGVGPILEAIDTLKVLEQQKEKPINLEKTAVNMAGLLLEFINYAKPGEGEKIALKQLTTGAALEKFWEIAKSQGAKKEVKSTELKTGKFKYEVFATKGGRIKFIDTKEVINVSRNLGTPFFKSAGLYFDKLTEDKVEKGDLLVTLYAPTQERLKMGKKVLDLSKMFDIV